MTRRVVLVLALAMVCVTSALSQTHGEDHAMAGGLPLHPTTKVAIPTEANRPIYKPARCDAQGNIYFRAYQADDRKVPVVRADAKGVTTRYSLDADVAFAQATSYDFSVLPDGNLYQPVQVGEDVYIVAFDKQGNIRRKTKLEKQFWVARLTALSNRSFLVLGTELQEKAQPKQAPESVIAIFDSEGRLVRRVNLDSPEAKINDSDSPASDVPEGTPVLAALSSEAQVTPGGVAYLMLPTKPVVVYTLDSLGRLTHSFKIDPPGARMAAISMSVSAGRLAILFRESFRGMQHNDAGTVLVVNASTGSEIGRYVATRELGTTLACYTLDTFVFVGSDNDKLAIQHASIK